ncbi:MAG: hypothetical protein PHT33_03880 [bacterium]|nr:hypothetical protein [bacterium]
MRKAGWVKIAALAVCMAVAGAAGYIHGEKPSVGAISLSRLQGLGLPAYTPAQALAVGTGAEGSKGIAGYAGGFLAGLSGSPSPGMDVWGLLKDVHNAEYQDEERILIGEKLSSMAKSLAQTADVRFRERYAAREAELFSDRDPVLSDLHLKIINAELKTLYALPEERDGLNARLDSLRGDLSRELSDRRDRLSAEMESYKKSLQDEIKVRLSSEASGMADGLRSERNRGVDKLHVPRPVPDWSAVHLPAWDKDEKNLSGRLRHRSMDGDAGRRLLNAALADKRQGVYNDGALRTISSALAAENGLTIVIGGAIPLHNCADLTAEAADILMKGRQ